jgi:hypothetical protein
MNTHVRMISIYLDCKYVINLGVDLLLQKLLYTYLKKCDQELRIITWQPG